MKSYKKGQPWRLYIFNWQKYNWYSLDFFMSSSSFQDCTCHCVVWKLNTKYVLSYIHKFLLRHNSYIHIYLITRSFKGEEVWKFTISVVKK